LQCNESSSATNGNTVESRLVVSNNTHPLKDLRAALKTEVISMGRARGSYVQLALGTAPPLHTVGGSQRARLAVGVTCIGWLLVAPIALAQAPATEAKTSLSALLKDGYEIRAVVGHDLDAVRSPYGFLAGAGVVLQKGVSVQVCEGLFPEASCTSYTDLKIPRPLISAPMSDDPAPKSSGKPLFDAPVK
jgi:hypothetical protein